MYKETFMVSFHNFINYLMLRHLPNVYVLFMYMCFSVPLNNVTDKTNQWRGYNLMLKNE